MGMPVLAISRGQPIAGEDETRPVFVRRGACGNCGGDHRGRRRWWGHSDRPILCPYKPNKTYGRNMSGGIPRVGIWKGGMPRKGIPTSRHPLERY